MVRAEIWLKPIHFLLPDFQLNFSSKNAQKSTKKDPAEANLCMICNSFNPPDLRMYTSTFTFKKKQYDDAFYALDEQIVALAKSIPGYLGEESWENATTGQVSNVYYWDSLEALQSLINNPIHQQAKAAQAKWLDGYQVIVAEVLRTYGDGNLPHPCLTVAPHAAN